MSTLHQLRQGLSTAWDSLTEGWKEFRERAGDALTLFQPKTLHSETENTEEHIVNRASRWGLLAAEVADDKDTLQVMLEAPGLEAKDFDIEVRDDILIIRGEKNLSRKETRGHYHVMERAYGHFERAIRLPVAVNDEGAQASYRAGVLTVSLPKSTSTTFRRISIDAQ